MVLPQIIYMLAVAALAIPAAYRLTHDIVSGSEVGTVVNQDDIDRNLNEVHSDYLVEAIINTYIGEHDGFIGPFGAYSWIRKFFSSEWMPDFVQEGICCRYCFSFWASYVCTAPILSVGFFEWLLCGMAVSGIIAAYFRFMQNFYGMDVMKI